MIYVIFIIFGLMPSIVWLLYYLGKDKHPESKRMILKIFLYGAFGAVLAFFIEVWLSWSLVFLGENIEAFPILFFIVNQFIIVALVEELCKFIVVTGKVINHREFDEPVDAMIYMIVAALGFAALENTLVLFSIGAPYFIRDAAIISSFRFLGATFLHTLASGVIGYYLALSFCAEKNKLFIVFKGIVAGVILHGLFNSSIIIIERGLMDSNMPLFVASFSFLIIILSGTGFFIASKFKELKKLKSTCKINNNYNNYE